MKKRLAMLFALCLMTGVLSSCGKDTGSTETTKKDDNTLVILNYGKYIDESVLDQFEKETGIKVKLEEYESPEEMYTKFSAGSINYDLVCTSDYMVERLINEDQVLEINFDDFEYYKNLDSSIIEASQIFDPENKYSMPYFYGTLGILYGGGDLTVYQNIAAAFTGITGYSFLVFNLLCAPCFAAIGAIKREMNNAKWTWFAIGYQCGFAYLIALMINQFGNAFTGSLNVIGLIAAIVVLAGMIYMLFKPYKEATKLSDKH